MMTLPERCFALLSTLRIGLHANLDHKTMRSFLIFNELSILGCVSNIDTYSTT